MQAVTELQRFSSDPKMRDLERRRRLWKLEYYSGLTAAKEEGVAIGEAIGKAKGEARGEARGIMKGKVQSILEVRFNKVPKRVEKAIQSMTDTAALESLAAHAKNCKSLDDFAEALK